MSKQHPLPSSRGPFRAEHVREGDPYELSAGHAIRVMPTGSRGSDAAATAAIVLKSDPAVEQAGVETGYKLAADTLRAPDVAVGNVPLKPGWVTGAPPLAVEYADTGQDEADLKTKIREFFAGGTRFVWVVRLGGPRRVEVYEPGREKRLAHPGEQLEAPGILKNPVPVEALYDWQVGQEVALRNLLQRHGYDSLEAVRAEGEAEGKAEGQLEALRGAILDLFTVRGLAASEDVKATITGCSDIGLLRRWHLRAAIAADAADIYFDDPE